MQLYSEVKANLSLGLETPRLGIVWFLVSLPLVRERQGREQHGSQLKSSLASIGKDEVSKSEPLPLVRNTKIGNSMVLSEPPSCVGTPRSRTVWFPVKILPCLYTARMRSASEPLPWVRNTKIRNSMVLSEPPSCVRIPRSRTGQFPVEILPCLYAARTRSVKENLSLIL